jgi:hypothetical protein
MWNDGMLGLFRLSSSLTTDRKREAEPLRDAKGVALEQVVVAHVFLLSPRGGGIRHGKCEKEKSPMGTLGST